MRNQLIGLLVFLPLIACGPKTETTTVENTTISDLNETDSYPVAEADTGPSWSFDQKQDPITDAQSYVSATEVSTPLHSLELSLSCDLNERVPTLTVNGYDTAGKSSAYSYGSAVMYRGDVGSPYSLNGNNTRFNNSRLISPSQDDLDSWMPLLGKQLTIRIPFQDGDDTFTVSLDSDNFRSAMAPCVANWKRLRRAAMEQQRENDRLSQAQNAMDEQSSEEPDADQTNENVQAF